MSSTTVITETESLPETRRPASTGRDVTTVMDYLQPVTDGITVHWQNPESFTNIKLQPTEVVISDVRGRENQFTLDKNGFQVVKHETSCSDLSNMEKSTAIYEPEMVELVKNM